MTAIGDALRKAGINTTEESSPESQRRISLETRIGYMKMHVDNIKRLKEKYFRIQGNAQDEMDTVSAMNSHFLYMVEAFKDIMNFICRQQENREIGSLREAARYFAANIVERLTDSEDAALSTFADRNDLAHRYELYEAVSDRTLRSCISYSEEYLLICRQIYAYCQQKGMLPQEDEKGSL